MINENSENAVAVACGSSQNNQRFSFVIPNQYRDGKTHKIWAYAIGKDSSGKENTINTVAAQSPQSFNIPADNAPIGLIDPINGPAISGQGWGVDNTIHGWVC